MANLLYLQLSSPSSSGLAASVRRRFSSGNCEIDLWRSIVSRRGSFECHASRGRFRFRAEEELFRGFEFGNRKKKRPWWLDDDDDDDNWMDGDEDWSMVFEVFRTVSWMLAPIGISLLLGTDSDSNAGLMALAVPLVQSVFSLVVNMVLSRPNIRPMKRSRRESFSSSATVKTRKARQEGVVDKGGYKSWMVGDADSNSTDSKYGGWDDLEKQREIRYDNPSNENVRSEKQFERKASRRLRVKEKPLFLRMLIATFPFLSSWTKLLF